jgi:HSP20 family molecular chaperone IbpA
MSAGVHRRNEIGSAVAAAGRAADVTTGAHAWPWGRFDVAVSTWSPAVDLIDRPDEVVVRADLPGFDREGVQLTAEPGVLHLRGVRRMNTDTMPGDSYHCVERWSGSFARTIRLPVEVDAGQMTATVTHGVLEMRVPKRVQAARESVEVQTDETAPSAGTGRAAAYSEPGSLPVRALYTA